MATGKVVPTKKLESWSFSRYSDYKQCPLKCKLKHIDKIKEPPNQAMARGSAIHNLAEGYIKGTEKKFPIELKLLKPEFDTLKRIYKKNPESMVVEDQWAFDIKWGESQWDNWAECWLRIKLDCAHHDSPVKMVVTDWKTGKFRESSNEEYVEQLELYALAALLLYPRIEEVLPRLGYTDQGVFYPEPSKPLIFTRDDIPRLKKMWEKRVKPMLSDTTFAPRPNDKCHWCHFSANKAGPCKY